MHRRAFLTAACSLIPSSAQAQTPPASGRFAEAAAYSAERGGVSFLVARHGVVLAEDYPAGGPDDRWPLGAGTRIFAPLLAAALVEDGLMGLDEPVAMTIGDWGIDPVKAGISMRALLNGTSGIAFDRRDGALPDALALTPTATPGSRFIDDAAPYMLMAEIARRKLDMAGRTPDPAVYLTERTLAAIGCVPIAWTRGPDGAARFHEGVAVSARGWAQVGELIRRQGVWQARQLVDGNALREACRGSFADARAGMGLWLAAGVRQGDAPTESDLWRMNPPAPADLAMAAGAGGQRLYIIPSANLVVVRQSRDLNARNWSDAAFLSRVSGDL